MYADIDLYLPVVNRDEHGKLMGDKPGVNPEWLSFNFSVGLN